jgi:hypothetical protein
MADAAKQDFDLHVILGWIAPHDPGGSKRRCCTGSGVSFRVWHGSTLDVGSPSRYAKYAILYAKYANMRRMFWRTSKQPSAKRFKALSAILLFFAGLYSYSQIAIQEHP